MPNRFAVPLAPRIYIAGPMSGIPDHNRPLFHKTAAALRGRGYYVVSPAEMFEHTDRSWDFYMRHAIQAMLTCNVLFLLPNWSSSKGAKLEHQIAWALEMPLYGSLDALPNLYAKEGII